MKLGLYLKFNVLHIKCVTRCFDMGTVVTLVRAVETKKP